MSTRMGKWRSVKRTAAVAATGLIAVLAPDPAAFSKDRGRPDLVRLGMSRTQVEALVGPSSHTCWNYDRGADGVERICFRDGMVHLYGETRREADRVYLKGVIAPDWPPPAPDISSKQVQFGMNPQAVTRLRGKPDSVDESYWVGDSGFDAAFVDGKLTTFEKSKPLPPHGSGPPPGYYMTFFDIGSTVLTPQGEQALKAAVQTYESIRGPATVEISAHTDGSEAQSHSPDLSRRRGEAVKNRLVALGIPTDRIHVLAKGDSARLVVTPPSAAEPQNRRVEIWVRW